jgi:hypothetical protein
VTQEIAGSMMLALMVLALGGAFWGWKRRQARYAGLAADIRRDVPAGAALFQVPALYVATTETDNPLERVAAGPLSYRSRAMLGVHPEGVSVSIPGQAAFLMPSTPGIRAGLATWTIDRVVEPEGLVMVRWHLGGREIDSYFRIVDGSPDDFVSAVGTIGKGTL